MVGSNLLIIGAGAHGQVVKETAAAMRKFSRIDFIDDNPKCSIAIGTTCDLMNLSGAYTYAFVAIGDNQCRTEISGRLEDYGYIIPVLVHPTAVVSPSAFIWPGTIVEAGAVVNSNVVVKENCILSIGVRIDHNVQIERASHVDCGAIIKAGCIVPALTKVHCGVVYGMPQQVESVYKEGDLSVFAN